MTLFRYLALDIKSQQIRGVIDAESLLDAQVQLTHRKIYATKIFPLESTNKYQRLKLAEILSLTRELGRLLEAGVALYESLSILEEKYRTHKTHELLLDLSDQIRGGRSFSQALKTYPQCFDILYRSMVANAEKSGSLASALEELSILLQRQLHVRKQLIGALLYPACLAIFCILVLTVLFFFVIPSLFELFEGRILHPFTRFVFWMSRFAISAKYFLMSGLLGIILWAGWILVSPKKRSYWSCVFFKCPGLRDLFIKRALIRFFHASASLLEAGVPGLTAMQQAKTTLQHPLLEQSIEEALISIEKGTPLSHALRERKFIPTLVPRMLAIAQEVGKLSTMMHQIALIYEEELEKTISQMTALAQPILLLILGLIIGFVLLAVLLPLTDVSNFVN